MEDLKQKVKEDVIKYVGVGSLKILALSPTKEARNKLYTSPDDKLSIDDDELVYTGIDKDSNQFIDLTLYLSVPPVVGAKTTTVGSKVAPASKPIKHTFRLNKCADRRKEKLIFINKQGASVQATDVDDAIAVHKAHVAAWPKMYASYKEPINYEFKQALKGEEDLVTFIRGLYGFDAWELYDISEEDMDKLFTGDLLKFPGMIGLQFAGLLLVNNKGYQTLYKKFYSTTVGRVTSHISNKLAKAINSKYDPFNFHGCFNRALYNKVSVFDITAPYYADYLKTSVSAADVAANASVEVGSEVEMDMYSMEEPQF